MAQERAYLIQQGDSGTSGGLHAALPQSDRWQFALLLNGGFRPFFLLAGTQASGFILLWIAGWLFGVPIPMSPDPLLWHGHALVYGFGSAAVAGFLLTAVPNWTSSDPVRGWRLGSLVLIWLVARLLSLWPQAVTGGLFAVADLAFWPILGGLVAPSILRQARARNGVFVVILTAFFATASAWHLEALGYTVLTGRPALYAALGLYSLMIAIVGGRIVPAFSMSGLRAAGLKIQIDPHPILDRAALTFLAVAFLAELLQIASELQAILFLIAAILHVRRFLLWQFWRSWKVPLVWSLHAGYAWLVIGLALKAAAAAGIAPQVAAIHALGAGCVGTMVLAVMTRASLGHTGRPLIAPAGATIAYTLVTLGAVCRVLAAFGPGDWLFGMTALAGGLWAGGYLVFTVTYVPILLKQRLDQRRLP